MEWNDIAVEDLSVKSKAELSAAAGSHAGGTSSFGTAVPPDQIAITACFQLWLQTCTPACLLNASRLEGKARGIQVGFAGYEFR